MEARGAAAPPFGRRRTDEGPGCDAAARIRHPMADINVSSLFSLSGKVALVTGGSRGIGRMMAEGLLQAGASVYISSRKQDVCDQTARDLSSIGPCASLPADVARPEGRAALIDALRAREDRLHVLINNAGAAWGAPYAEYPESAWDKVLGLNVKAPFLLTRDLTPLLEQAATAADPARIINVGSIDGLHVPQIFEAGTFAYSASKAAVHHLTRTLAVELGPRNITVNAVAPGFFESRMTAGVMQRHGPDIVSACPLGRIGRPEDMAGIAIYLASRAGAYTNGAVIPVDGGTWLTRRAAAAARRDD